MPKRDYASKLYAQKGDALKLYASKGLCLMTVCLKGNMPYDCMPKVDMPNNCMPKGDMPFDWMPIYCPAVFSNRYGILLHYIPKQQDFFGCPAKILGCPRLREAANLEI